MSKGAYILLYQDIGADKTCVDETLRSLKQILVPSRYLIQLVDRQFLNSEDWENDTQLIVMPGGRSLPFYEALGEKGNQKIKKFVNQGGNYLGICAGGYYGCNKTIFEKGGDLEVICEGPLDFFPGNAEGPVYGLGKFSYDQYQGAQMATIAWNNSTKQSEIYGVYYNGGAAFVNAEKYENVQVLARYQDIENQPAAIVRCKVGNGCAILTGVHAEYSYRAIDLMKAGADILLKQLKAIETARVELWRRILCNINLL